MKIGELYDTVAKVKKLAEQGMWEEAEVVKIRLWHDVLTAIRDDQTILGTKANALARKALEAQKFQVKRFDMKEEV